MVTKYVINVVVTVLLAMSSLHTVAGHSNDTADTGSGMRCEALLL